MNERRILLVDDTPAIHEDYRKSLGGSAPGALDALEAELFGGPASATTEGFQLDSAFQGEAACELLQQALEQAQPYALAFVDMRMPPGWDGARTVERMWQIDPRLQVVICTAYSDHDWEDLIPALAAGDRLLILKKPFDPIEVRQLAESLSRKWRVERQAEAKIEDLEQAVSRRTEELTAANQQLQSEIAERINAQQLTASSEARYRQLFEGSPLPAWVFDCETLQFLAVNPAAIAHYGYSESEFLAMRLTDIRPPEEHAALREHLRDLPSSDQFDSVWTHRCKDGRLIKVNARGHQVDFSARTARLVLVQDVTARLQAEQRVKRLNRMIAVTSAVNALIVRVASRDELFQSLTALAVDKGLFHLAFILELRAAPLTREPDSVAPLDSAGESAERSTLQSTAPLALSAAAADINLDHTLVAIQQASSACQRDPDSPLQRLCRESRIQVLRATGDDDHTGSPLQRHALSLGCHSVALVPFELRGEVVAALALYVEEADYFDAEENRLLTELGSDVSFALEHLRKEEQLNYLAYFDVLTGLANRSLFLDRLQQQLSSPPPPGFSRSVVLIDLRRFRHINSLGRSVGDAMLRAVAERLRAELGVDATVARLGGDSFALSFHQALDESALMRMVEQHVLAVFAQPFQFAEQELRVSVHLGVALHPGDGDDGETLLKNAEAAMKRAKRLSEPVVFYSPDMNARVASALRLENRLRQAIDREEFVLHFQPQVRASDGQVIGFEALVRWNSPEKGMVMPGGFIAVAEDAGLIGDLGRFVLFDACRQAKEWLDQGHADFVVAVNVSAVQLYRPGFGEEVLSAIAKYDLPAHLIELEITESAIMENIDRMGEVLQSLKRIGVTVALDDFGTGYSSLSRLRVLPIDKLKIDQSFVGDLARSPDDAAIVKTIIAMSHQLQKRVIAEGVETHPQLDFLRAHGVDECQGRLFGMAIPAEQAGALLGTCIRPSESKQIA